MKRYSVSVVRERLADALDEAEAGIPVVIERHGVRFRLEREPVVAARGKRPGVLLEIVDPAVSAGQWTWADRGAGLAFTPRPRRRARR